MKLVIRLGPLIAISLFACQGHSMNSQSQPPPPSELKVVGLPHLPEYVIGYPVYVAIVLQAPHDTSFNRLPFANVIDLRECVGLEMADRGGNVVARYAAKPVLDPETGAIGEALGGGGVRRMLIDVSPLIPTTIPEGDYQLRFAYVAPRVSCTADPITVHFRRPNPTEQAQITSLAAERARFPNWATWTVTRPQAPIQPASVKPDNPLKLNLLLRRLFFGAEPLDRIDPALLDVLTGLYGSEANALKAELYHARGDSVRYQDLKTRTLATDPGLAWWFDITDAGGGFLSSFRIAPPVP